MIDRADLEGRIKQLQEQTNGLWISFQQAQGAILAYQALLAELRKEGEATPPPVSQEGA